MPDLTIFEEDREPVITPTGLLGPNGEMIAAVEHHPGMNFIGFVSPDDLERNTEKQAAKVARKKKG